MSVNQNALSALPQSVTAANAESGAKSALSTWKEMSGSWEQETADAVGNASANYAIKWNNAVIPVIDEKIQKCQADYDEKKSQYECLCDQMNDAERLVKDAQNDMENCMGYEEGPTGSGMFAGMSQQNITDKKIIIDHYGYNEAKKREAQAKIEVNRIKTQVSAAEKLMNTALSNLKNAEEEKEILTQKIEEFILDVYNLKLMNESVEFLTVIKNSQITLSQETKNTLFSRLFFIQNAFRKQFEKFEELITQDRETYKEQKFTKTPESLSHIAIQKIKAKKIKGMITTTLESKDINSAKLNYSAKKDFIIPKKKIENATKNIQPLCKNFELTIDRNVFKIELNKNYENDAIVQELEQFNEHSKECVSEYTTLLEELIANGASNNKIRILFGKIVNWHLNHWPKLWYKIISIVLTAFLTTGILAGTIVGISELKANSDYKKSFVKWEISNDKETNEFRRALKRFKLDEDRLLEVFIKSVTDKTLQSETKRFMSRLEKDPEQFIPFTDELNTWLKQALLGSLPSGKSIKVYLKFSDGKGNISKRKGKRTFNMWDGYFEVTTAENGSIISITDLIGTGLKGSSMLYVTK